MTVMAQGFLSPVKACLLLFVAWRLIDTRLLEKLCAAGTVMKQTCEAVLECMVPLRCCYSRRGLGDGLVLPENAYAA